MHKPVLLLLLLGLAATTARSQTRTLDFDIFWPPRDPTIAPAPGVHPLLKGTVTLNPTGSVLRLGVTLRRPADEAARQFWNSRLAFPEYDWMRYVRVWDADRRWLWPNLPYLLRLHGLERVEHYGGVDPAKGVDNDFAAVLIRKYGGPTESPLVAAEWYPVGVTATETNGHTIVHAARSDEFTLHPGNAPGRAGVWLIYADFMGTRVPANWPKQLEYAGGILAFFELQWEPKPTGGWDIAIRQTVPKQSTGFDWEEWANRTLAAPDSKSTSKLSDQNPK